MLALIDFILNLFRSEDAARAFVAAPEQAMRDAGVVGVGPAQLASVASAAVPGVILGEGDPIVGLQRALSNQYDFAGQYGFVPSYQPSYTPSYDPTWNSAPTFAPSPSFAPSPTFAPETNTDLASHNSTDLASHNDTSLFSPPQEAGANAQQGAFNLGFGDITLGRKTTTTATNGGVAVAGDTHGDIVSGDGAVLGNENAVTNGGIRAEHGSNVSTGQAAVIHDSGTTTTAGADAVTSIHNGSSTSIGGSQTTTAIDGTGNTTAADGHQATTVTHTTATTTTETTDSSDNSLHQTTVTDSSTHDASNHSLFDVSHDTSLANSTLDNSHDLALASGNQMGHLLGF